MSTQMGGKFGSGGDDSGSSFAKGWSGAGDLCKGGGVAAKGSFVTGGKGTFAQTPYNGSGNFGPKGDFGKGSFCKGDWGKATVGNGCNSGGGRGHGGIVGGCELPGGVQGGTGPQPEAHQGGDRRG